MDFIDFARSHGLQITALYPSEKIKRCGTTLKPRSDNGAYFWDGTRGWIMDWSGEAKVVWYSDSKPWTEEDKQAWRDRRRAQSTEQSKRYEEAGKRAQETLQRAQMADHNYFEYKGLKGTQGLVIGDALLIPMRDVHTNALQGYQRIVWVPHELKYEKKMMPGMRARNAVHYLGGRSSEYWLVEGYVTGLSLLAALRSCGSKASVIVCFSANNLIQVAGQLKGQVFVFADNDKSQTGQQAAEQTGRPWTMADEEGFDANDLHVKSGLFAVVKKIMELKKKHLTEVSRAA